MTRRTSRRLGGSRAAVGRFRGNVGTGSPDTRDTGSGGVWLLTVVGVVLAATVGGLAVAGALVARQRAETAADLAALAAARAASRGEAPCATAARVAAAGGAELTGCQAAASGGRAAADDPASAPVAGLGPVDVTVVVTVSLPRLLRPLDVPPARARARAGVPP